MHKDLEYMTSVQQVHVCARTAPGPNVVVPAPLLPRYLELMIGRCHYLFFHRLIRAQVGPTTHTLAMARSGSLLWLRSLPPFSLVSLHHAINSPLYAT